MGCPKLNEEKYKGIKIIMAKGKNNKKSILSGNQLYKFAKSNGGILTIGVLVISTVWAFAYFFFGMQQDIKDLKEMEAKVFKMYDDLYLNGGIEDQLEDLQKEETAKVININNEEAMLIMQGVSIHNNGISHTTSALYAEMQLGVDANGHVYMAEELIGETILLTYKDEGKDVFLLGQYSKDYLWDGYCVTNSYNQDGTLYGICEMNYENGKRLDYKTIMTNGHNEWGYYSRTCNGDVNSGVSIEYIFEYDKQKNFTDTNVRRIDIMYVDNFIENQEKRMTKYYVGNTSDSKYNDDTGSAYLIKFDDDGFVTRFYVGCFKNGKLHDESGNAWNIVYWDDGGYYVCNTGVFRNNSAENHSIDKLTLEEIAKKVEEVDVPFELKWKM